MRRQALFTPEQVEYLRSINSGRTAKQCAEAMNDKFGFNLSGKQIKSYRANHKFPPSGMHGRFKKGMPAWNKGKKLPGHGGSQTFFKKGHRPHNALPVGSVVARCGGYLWEKVAEPRLWRLKHVMIWEAAHGPRPSGSTIVFLNQDKTDIRLENLALVSRAELARLNQKGLLFPDAKRSKVGVTMAKIFAKIGRRKREK